MTFITLADLLNRVRSGMMVLTTVRHKVHHQVFPEVTHKGNLKVIRKDNPQFPQLRREAYFPWIYVVDHRCG